MAFLHASKSGYFPFCLEEATEGEYGAGTIRPFEMSLEDAMALYWKYKSFKVTGSIIGNFNAQVIDNAAFIFQMDGTGASINTGQPKMSDLVCNDFYSAIIYVIEESNDHVIASPLSRGKTSVDIVLYGSIKKTPEANSGQKLKIYPFLFMRVGAIIESTMGAYFAYFAISSTLPQANFITAISDGFQIKINGTTYKAPMYVLTDSNYGQQGSASGFLMIEGVEERLAE